MDIGEWLRSLGLGQYEPAFRDNEVDHEVLLKLTAEDLRELGVVAVGHRRKLLDAVAALNKSAPAKGDAAEAPGVSPAIETSAERRQLSLIFCDLVGSTALSARLDPEDMRGVIRAYQDACSAAVARYDGFVAKFMGDGVLAYFGYPVAHEDDAERAVRAALEMRAAITKLETCAKDKLRVRLGIATGLVVVGDLIGQGSAQEQTVVGETPNLAARLQTLAEPGGILIAESTRRLVGGSFELKALGPQALKGFDAAVPVWAVVGEAENVSRFEASRSDAMTPLVGREQEMGLLIDRWREATTGEGQVVLLSGEAGIGKSRILAVLRERLGGERYFTLRYQCSPHHSNEAFYPISGHIWHAAGFTSDEPAAARLDKLEAMIARSGVDSREIAPLLASLLSIPADGRYPAIEVAPGEQKERTISAIIDLFVGLAQDAPVLALLEDAHWIDPTSRDLLGRLIERLQGLRALLVVTYRPEFAAPWLGRGHVTALSLNRFGRRQAFAMIERVTGGKTLPLEVLDQIIAKTDGVPLFVEELTKTVLESGLLRAENGTYALAAPLTPFAIPSTLQDSLMARLDRLASVREIAQIGAVIGREFSYRLLEAVSPVKGPTLKDALQQLTASELIYGRGAPPEASYIFKHALVQDAAYNSLLRSRRQRIHADLAKALTERFADQVDSAPATIARHYTEAGLAEPGARNWLTAAELALSRSAHAEARPCAEAGLALIPQLTEGPNRQSLELALQLARANAMVPLKGFTGSETVAAFTEAKRLLDAGVGTDLQQFSVLYGLWATNLFAARMEPALALARQFADVAERNDDTTYRLVGYRMAGTMHAFVGQNRQALDNLQRAEQHRDPNRRKVFTYRFGVDPDLHVLSAKIWPLILVGQYDRAAQAAEQLRAELSNHKHAATVAVCNYFALWAELLSGELETCERHSAELIVYCAEKKVEQWRLLGTVCNAFARATLQPTGENIVAARAALSAKNQMGIRMFDSFFTSQLARVLLSTGDVSGAEAMLRQALAFVEDSGERFWIAEVHRLDGVVALDRTEPARAEACFLEAMKIAGQQESRMLELRAATDLARLRRGASPHGDPSALLQPILATIEGGENTHDVHNARALLAEFG